jgi:predicted DNA-binding protein (UPF0251 family)
MAPAEIKSRSIEKEFATHFFKPKGIPLMDLQIVTLGHEEMEAVRLIDVDHMNQIDAAKKMNISRATMQRVIDAAREKIGRALIEGHAIEITGGNYIIKDGCGRRGRRDGQNRE